MARPKSAARRRDLILRAAGIGLDDLSVGEADWVAAAALAIAYRRPLPPWGDA